MCPNQGEVARLSSLSMVCAKQDAKKEGIILLTEGQYFRSFLLAHG